MTTGDGLLTGGGVTPTSAKLPSTGPVRAAEYCRAGVMFEADAIAVPLRSCPQIQSHPSEVLQPPGGSAALAGAAELALTTRPAATPAPIIRLVRRVIPDGGGSCE